MDDHRSQCPLASALDLLGDKWSLVVVRDATVGKRRYGDFLGSPEGIPTNILADRLKRLERLGILRKQVYQARPRRYEYLLTEKGADLLPVLQQLVHWARKHIPNRWSPPPWFVEATPERLLERLAGGEQT